MTTLGLMLFKLILSIVMLNTCDALEIETCDCENIEIVTSDKRTIRYGGGLIGTCLLLH